MIEIEAPDGSIVEFPDGTAPDVMKAALARRFAAPKPEGGIVKKAGAFLGGMQDSVMETLGAIPDLSAKATNALGLTNIPDGYNTKAIKEGWNSASRAMGGNPEAFTPETTGEKFLYGAGHGVGDAAAVAVPAAGVARTAQAGGVTQRVAQALASQPGMQAAAGAVGGGVGEATDNPLLGLAAAMAVPAGVSAVGRAVTPVRSQLNPEQQRLANVMMQEGVDLTAGQRTGSRPLQLLESVWQSLPFTARPAAEQSARQQQQFNRAVLSRAGVNADSASPQVMDQAFTRLGNEFERLSNGVTVDLTSPNFQQAIANATARYGRKLPSQTRDVFQNYVDDITALNGQMPGQQYQVTRSDLTKQSRAARGQDPYFAEALRDLRNALDDAADASMPPAQQQEWRDARRQYANLKTIAKAATGGGKAGAGGDIAPAQIYGAAKKDTGTDQFSRGRGELNDLSRAGQTFLRELPNSTTAERTFWQNLMTGSMPGMAAGGAIGGIPGAVAGATATLAGPRIAQMAYNSGPVQSYLTNQVMAGTRGLTPEIAAALLAAEEKRQITSR
jgi:hypothetical protein